MNIGNIVLKKLKQEISSSEWERYIKTLNYDENASRSNLAQFYAPNMLLAKWIKTKYQSIYCSAGSSGFIISYTT